MIAALVLVGGACSSDETSPVSGGDDPSSVTAPTTPKPKREPLVLTWAESSLVVAGDCSTGLANQIDLVIQSLEQPRCFVRHASFEAWRPEAGAASLPDLPIADIAELICGAKAFDITFDYESMVVKGTAVFGDVRMDGALSPKYVGRTVAGWTYSLETSVDSEKIPAGSGRLMVMTGEGGQDKKWTIDPVVGGEIVTETLRDGWNAVLTPGIYVASNRDHFAIRDGFETVFVPDNPAAIFFGGRRFPLDDTVPIYAGIVSRGPDSIDRDSIDTCNNPGEPEMPRCGHRYARAGVSIATTDIAGAQALVNQVVIHFDGTRDSDMALRVLRSRGLSDHILIDFDGTIIQSVDLTLAAYHAGMANNRAVSLLFNNMSKNLVKEPNAPMYPEDHDRIEDMQRHPRAKSKIVTINGYELQHYGYTEAQWRSGLSVSRLLVRLLPGLAPAYPKDADGGVLCIPLADAASFSGFLAHSTWEAERWDPGPGFDWERLATAFAPKARP